MSEKINTFKIIKHHYKSLTSTDGKVSCYDIITFFVLPFVCAVLFIFKNWVLSDAVISIFINLGSIFTALLISVLIMLYDQEQKITSNLISLPLDEDPHYREKLSKKRELMREVFANISYAIITAIILVFSSLTYQILTNSHWLAQFLFMPLSIFCVINLLLTVLMVIKRTYNLILER